MNVGMSIGLFGVVVAFGLLGLGMTVRDGLREVRDEISNLVALLSEKP